MEHSLSSDLILDSETRTSFSRVVAKLGSESESVMLVVADNRGLRPRNKLTMSYESRTGRPTSHNIGTGLHLLAVLINGEIPLGHGVELND